MKNKVTHLLICPHCGASRLIAFSKDVWPKVDHVFWSDGRIDSAEWFEPARILQCPSCKRFFRFTKDVDNQEVQTPCDYTLRLPYQTLKQAIVELSGNDKDESVARMEAWWAYNKLSMNTADEVIPAAEREFNQSNMQWLLNYYEKTEWEFYILRFELLRLLGRDDEYRQLLAGMTYERYAEWYLARHEKMGLTNHTEEKDLREKYTRRVEGLTAALDKPRRPYAQ